MQSQRKPSARSVNVRHSATQSLTTFRCHISVPRLGRVDLAASAKGLVAVALPAFGDATLRPGLDTATRCAPDDHPILAHAARELRAYAAGNLQRFTIPYDLTGMTPFTTRVLTWLAKLKWGRCVSYGEVAARCGSPSGARAVGGAVGRNPIPIVIPCHRVLAGNGIGGFGLGLDCKRLLLRLEGLDDIASKS